MEGVIKKIVIDRLTDEQLSHISDCIVNRQANNTFFENCVYDRHMGVCDRGKICEVCSADWARCIGGYGLIKLPIAYYFPGNSKLIGSILHLLCSKCASFLVAQEEIETALDPLRLKTQLKLQKSPFYKLITRKKRKCSCGGNNLLIIEKKNKDDKKRWDFEFQTEEGVLVSVQQIKTIFQKVGQATLQKLEKIGIKIHPDSLLNSHLLVVPVSLRPYMVKDNQYLHNDLSTIYNSIIKEVGKKTTSQKQIYEKIEMLLTQKKKKPLPNSSKIPQSLQDRIQGKEGLINANINGKRVNHSSRTTITGWPDGKLGEVGIPESMAEKMTLQVSVASIKGDIKLWIEEHKPYRLTKKNGACFRFTTEKTTARIIANIEPSDLLERKAVDGDIVLFNRQPSLRPESIIAKKIKIIKNCNTFRLTLPCTPPLNADFDGDECNVHILQDLPARVECYELMNPAEQLISTQKGTPLIAPVQDALVGCYLLTETTTRVSRSFLFDVVMALGVADSLDIKMSQWNRLNEEYISKEGEVPGKFIFSLCLEKIDFVHASTSFRIVEGIVSDKSCPVNKKILCGGITSLIHFYTFAVGNWKTCELIDRIQTITNLFLAKSGFTIGLSDCLEKKCFTDRAFYNKKNINTALGVVETQMLKTAQEKTNNFLKVVKSGAKGSMTNVVQVTQIVGQQSIDGTKLRNEMKSQRTLASFPLPRSTDRAKDNVYSTGFVFHCFFEGLEKSENYFHCKAGRRGVADSVTKVSESGYLAKKICKFMEDYLIEHDLSVRHNATKQIIQFKFGSDGFNPKLLPAVDGEQGVLTNADLVKTGIRGTREEQIAALCLYLLNSNFGLTKRNFLNTELQHSILEHCIFTDSPGTTDFTPENAEQINELVLEKFFEPGTPIGLICGTNFGEISSQLLLKSFHHSGIKSKDISGGIKRLTQLLCRATGRTRENVVVVARLKDHIYDYLKTLRKITDHQPTKEICRILMEDIATSLLNKVKIVPFETFVTSVVYEGSPSETFIKHNSALREDEFLVSFFLNPNTLEDYDLNNVKVFAILKRHFADLSLRGNVVEMKVVGRPSDLPRMKQKCLGVNVSHESATIEYCDLEFNESLEEFEVIFKGVSLSQALSISFVDERFAYSTDPFENFKVLGVEAARQSLYKEIIDVLTFDGADINKRYISLICDAMCHSGSVRSIADTDGVLTSALFEKEVKKFNHHSIERSEDPCTSLEACVFLGKICRMGTGFIDVLPCCTSRD